MLNHEVTTAERALMDALDFTTEDLEANRAGHLSDAQRRRLAQRTVLMAAVTLIAGVTFVLAYNALPERASQTLSLTAFILMPLALAVLAFGAFECFGTFIKLQRNTITAIRGPADLEVDPSRRKLFGKLTVGSFTMFVPKTQLAAFHPGDTYAIYYTPYPKQVFSAEFISPAPRS